MYSFDYIRARDLGAARRLGREDDEAVFLSGGMTLLPTMKQRLAAPSSVIDLTTIESLRGIETTTESRLRVGACTRHADVAASGTVAAFCPALMSLAAGIGDPAVRHRGTMGGSLANNDPAADYPAAALALKATLTTSDRRIEVGDFFLGLFETDLQPGEILTSIEFARPTRAGYGKFPNPASRYAMAGVFVAVFLDEEVRVAVTGAGANGVFRWSEAEKELTTSWGEAAFDKAEIDETALMSDMHGAADYRGALMRAMGKQALRAAI